MKNRYLYFALLALSAIFASLVACGEGNPFNLEDSYEWRQVQIAVEDVVNQMPGCFSGTNSCPEGGITAPEPQPPASSSSAGNPGPAQSSSSESSSPVEPSSSSIASSSSVAPSSSSIASSSSVAPSSSSVASSSSIAPSSSSVAPSSSSVAPPPSSSSVAPPPPPPPSSSSESSEPGCIIAIAKNCGCSGSECSTQACPIGTKGTFTLPNGVSSKVTLFGKEDCNTIKFKSSGCTDAKKCSISVNGTLKGSNKAGDGISAGLVRSPVSNNGTEIDVVVSGGDGGDLTLYCDGAENLNQTAAQSGAITINACH